MSELSKSPSIPDMEMRKHLRVDPNQVIVNHAGFAFRDVFVRLPSGIIADDLKEPALWSKVQSSAVKALKKFDRLVIASFDETWMAECFVETANSEVVLLAKPRITVLSERVEKLFSDGTYRVNWSGTGYNVVRLRDEAIMTESFQNAALAERALGRLYPKRA